MGEQRDDTTDGGTPSRTERPSGKYYYDDATGYEVYDPSKDDDDDDEETDGAQTNAESKHGEHDD